MKSFLPISSLSAHRLTVSLMIISDLMTMFGLLNQKTVSKDREIVTVTSMIKSTIHSQQKPG